MEQRSLKNRDEQRKKLDNNYQTLLLSIKTAEDSSHSIKKELENYTNNNDKYSKNLLQYIKHINSKINLFKNLKEEIENLKNTELVTLDDLLRIEETLFSSIKELLDKQIVFVLSDSETIIKLFDELEKNNERVMNQIKQLITEVEKIHNSLIRTNLYRKEPILKQEEIISFEDLVYTVSEIFKTSNKQLKDLDIVIIKGIFIKDNYQNIAEKSNRATQSIKNEAYRLFNFLSEKLNKKISKNNFLSALSEYYQSIQNQSSDNTTNNSIKAKDYLTESEIKVLKKLLTKIENL